MSSRRVQVCRTSARFLASRAVLVIAAMTILLGVLRGGTRFFYCPMTHLAFDEPPCTAPHGEADVTDGPRLELPECCEEKWRAVTPRASSPSIAETAIAPASVVALLPAAQLDITRRSLAQPMRFWHAVRAGPPPLASERRAQLMVFNI